MNFFRNAWAIWIVFKSLISFGKNGRIIDQARRSGDNEKERQLICRSTTEWAAELVNNFDMRVHISGEENLPKSGPVVFISNHQSYLDIVVFLYAIKNIQIGFIAKEALGKVPFLNRWILRIRGIFIRRGDAKASLQTINEGVDLLKNGYSLVIFPEGTRSKSKKMNKFKPGSFKLATKANVPIIPVTLNGTYNVYEGTGVLTKGVDITFHIHPQVNTSDIKRPELLAIPGIVEDTISSDLK